MALERGYMKKEELRNLTEESVVRELNKMCYYYMKIYDEYYENGSKDSAFLKDLFDSLIGISAVLEVYVEHKGIHPNYAIEKLNNSKSYIEATIRYFENKGEKLWIVNSTLKNM